MRAFINPLEDLKRQVLGTSFFFIRMNPFGQDCLEMSEDLIVSNRKPLSRTVRLVPKGLLLAVLSR